MIKTIIRKELNADGSWCIVQRGLTVHGIDGKSAHILDNNLDAGAARKRIKQLREPRYQIPHKM